MAESLWGKRYRVAAAVLLGGSALLALLDLAARSGNTDASAIETLIAIVLALATWAWVSGGIRLGLDLQGGAWLA